MDRVRLFIIDRRARTLLNQRRAQLIESTTRWRSLGVQIDVPSLTDAELLRHLLDKTIEPGRPGHEIQCELLQLGFERSQLTGGGDGEQWFGIL